MKKILLSLSLIFAFTSYAFYARSGTQAVPAVKDESSAVIPATLPTVAVSPTKKTQPSVSSGLYKNGIYTGTIADAYYGYVQVKTTITGGKIADVQFLDYPHDRNTSRFINSQAMPMLKSEAIKAQSAKVNIISGATDTSKAFRESLTSALSQALA
jgi:uncharacterized protein with FMN-binding domain